MDNVIRLIVGRKGQGKTTLAKKFMKSYDPDLVFVFDYLGEYKEVKNRSDNIRHIVHLAWKVSGRKLLVFDEVDLYADKKGYRDFLEKVFRYGRHRKLDLIAISRRFYDLPPYIRALADEIYCFQIIEENDLRFLAGLNKDVAIRVKKLGKFEYIKIDL